MEETSDGSSRDVGTAVTVATLLIKDDAAPPATGLTSEDIKLDGRAVAVGRAEMSDVKIPVSTADARPRALVKDDSAFSGTAVAEGRTAVRDDKSPLGRFTPAPRPTESETRGLLVGNLTREETWPLESVRRTVVGAGTSPDVVKLKADETVDAGILATGGALPSELKIDEMAGPAEAVGSLAKELKADESPGATVTLGLFARELRMAEIAGTTLAVGAFPTELNADDKPAGTLPGERIGPVGSAVIWLKTDDTTEEGIVADGLLARELRADDNAGAIVRVGSAARELIALDKAGTVLTAGMLVKEPKREEI